MFNMKPKPTIYSMDAVAAIKEAALLLSKALGEVKQHVRPGVSTLELDTIIDEYIVKGGGEPAFKNYAPGFADGEVYQYATCMSVNEAVVHGLPSKDVILKEGDIVSVDVGVKLNGFFADSAYTFAVGEVAPEVKELMDVTRDSLYKGIAEAVHGKRVGDVSNAVQRTVQKHGYGIVKEMVGHGLGKHVHEPPEVPNYGKRGSGPLLQDGMVIAIEPMINLGKGAIRKAGDGWTIYTADRKPSAHYEHTVVIRRGQPEILTTFSYIEN